MTVPTPKTVKHEELRVLIFNTITIVYIYVSILKIIYKSMIVYKLLLKYAKLTVG